jgi:hypothetical protein
MSRGLDQSVLLLGGVRHRSKVPRTPGKDTVSDRTSKWNPTQFVAVRDAINSIIAGMVVGVNETASAEQILTLTVTLANGTRSVTFSPEQRVVLYVAPAAASASDCEWSRTDCLLPFKRVHTDRGAVECAGARAVRVLLCCEALGAYAFGGKIYGPDRPQEHPAIAQVGGPKVVRWRLQMQPLEYTATACSVYGSRQPSEAATQLGWDRPGQNGVAAPPPDRGRW